MTSTTRPRRERPPKDFPRRTPERYPIQWVRTSRLKQYCNPFEGCWADLSTPLRLEEVQLCLERGTETPHPPFKDWYASGTEHEPTNRRLRAEKIAWFARHGFTKSLEVEVGVPSLRCYVKWFVQDGNHRLAAGIVRQHLLGEDPWLPLSVGGDIDYAKELGLW